MQSTIELIGVKPTDLKRFCIQFGEGSTTTLEIVTPKYLGHNSSSVTSTEMIKLFDKDCIVSTFGKLTFKFNSL